MNVYIFPRNLQKNLLGLKSEYSNVAGYKINIQEIKCIFI